MLIELFKFVVKVKKFSLRQGATFNMARSETSGFSFQIKSGDKKKKFPDYTVHYEIGQYFISGVYQRHIVGIGNVLCVQKKSGASSVGLELYSFNTIGTIEKIFDVTSRSNVKILDIKGDHTEEICVA